ncbi:MAG: hypothetical protein JWM11_448 [Planctomycetaceae bacterium]|nr:hypothetical protein [Planctomycetaceae bacterium]
MPGIQPIHEWKLDGEVAAMEWSRDGSVIAAGLVSGEIVLVDPETWKVSARFTAAKVQVTGVCFSPDGKMLACRFASDTVSLFNVKTQILARQIQLPEESWSNSIEFSADGKLFCIGSNDGDVSLYSTETWAVVARFREADARLIAPDSTPIISTTAFHPNSRKVAVGIKSGALLLSANGLVEEKGFPTTECAVYTMAFTRDGKLLATAGPNVQIWNIAGQGEPLSIPREFPGSVCHLDFSDDGKFLLIPYDTGTGRQSIVAVYSLEHGKTVVHFPCRTNILAGACFIPNTHRIATAAKDGTILEWSVNLEEPK